MALRHTGELVKEPAQKEREGKPLTSLSAEESSQTNTLRLHNVANTGVNANSSPPYGILGWGQNVVL